MSVIANRKAWVRSALSAILLGSTVFVGSAQVRAQGRDQATRASAPVTIQYWHTWTLAETNLYNKMQVQFKKSHPGITINVYNIPYAERATKVPTAVQTNTLPDVLRADYPYQFYLAALHKSLPLNQYLKGWDGLKDIPSWMWQYATYHGDIVAIPQDYWPRALYYNKTLFKKAGIAGPPTTWSAFVSDAKKLTANGVAGFGLEADTSQGGAFLFDMLLALEGGKFFKDPSSITADGASLNTPAAQKAQQLFSQLVDSHAYEANPVGTTYNDIVQGFQSGKIAMYIDGSWAVQNYASTAPKLDYGIAPLPALPGASYKVFADYSWYTIPSTTQHISQDVTFLEWMLSPSNTLNWAITLNHIPPVRTSNVTDPAFTKYLAAHPIYKAFVYPANSFAPISSIEPQVPFDNAINTAMAQLLQSYLLGKTSASGLLPAMQSAVQAVVKSNS
jgi:multiple sugar transport system substrate-binding protein